MHEIYRAITGRGVVGRRTRSRIRVRRLARIGGSRWRVRVRVGLSVVWMSRCLVSTWEFARILRECTGAIIWIEWMLSNDTSRGGRCLRPQLNWYRKRKVGGTIDHWYHWYCTWTSGGTSGGSVPDDRAPFQLFRDPVIKVQ